VNSTFYKVPLLSAWNPNSAAACGIQANGTPGSYNMATGVENIANCFTSNGITAPDGKQANTVGQAVGQLPSATGLGNTNGAQVFGTLPANNADYTSFGVSPVKDFSETTGRVVWDLQINDDTLFYASYSKGFKGGGFNPPFNAAQFPNTPFAFESTNVDAFEFGVKASVPEEGITANASIYYYDFTNYHIGVIRNETAINTGMPLETMGAELEFYLAPPSLPGLSFNMMFSYQTSEVGNFSMINPHDLGGHYRQQASTGSMDGYTDWHVAKNQTANSFLLNKNAFGYMYGKILDVQLNHC
jgi:outer membrane receptor protein involved in Fe transport